MCHYGCARGRMWTEEFSVARVSLSSGFTATWAGLCSHACPALSERHPSRGSGSRFGRVVASPRAPAADRIAVAA